MIGRLRAICLALPGAVEKETWETPTFRVRDKIFALVHDVGGRSSVWLKAPPGVQAMLTEAAPERFFRPPYLGHRGWIGVWLDVDLDPEDLAALVGRSHAMTAPKRMLSSSDDKPDAPSRRKSPPSRRPMRRRSAV